MASLELKRQNTGSCLAQMFPIPNVIFHTWVMMHFQSKILKYNTLCEFGGCAITCWFMFIVRQTCLKLVMLQYYEKNLIQLHHVDIKLC